MVDRLHGYVVGAAAFAVLVGGVVMAGEDRPGSDVRTDGRQSTTTTTAPDRRGASGRSGHGTTQTTATDPGDVTYDRNGASDHANASSDLASTDRGSSGRSGDVGRSADRSGSGGGSPGHSEGSERSGAGRGSTATPSGGSGAGRAVNPSDRGTGPPSTGTGPGPPASPSDTGTGSASDGSGPDPPANPSDPPGTRPDPGPGRPPGSGPPVAGPGPGTTPPGSGPPGTAPPISTAAQAYGWQLVAADEFDGPAVDPGRWEIYDSVGNGGVGLRRPNAVSQSDGELRITGRGDVSGGLSWRGGRMYGRWEVRARSDRGNGYAPCILLWPTSNQWPEDGEIDVMEIPRGDRQTSHFTLHWGADNSQTGFSVNGDFSAWHTFAVEWQPDHVTFFLDGQPLYTSTDPEAIPRSPMQLAIQNDVGPFNNWIPPRDTTTPAEVTLHVDWVRLYAP